MAEFEYFADRNPTVTALILLSDQSFKFPSGVILVVYTGEYSRVFLTLFYIPQFRLFDLRHVSDLSPTTPRQLYGLNDKIQVAGPHGDDAMNDRQTDRFIFDQECTNIYALT